MPLVKPWTRTLLPLALAGALGCQDYNFNPVGHCLIQPGSERVTLSNLSTADVLFVIDDSGSMGGEQQLLANNFATFIQNLNTANAERQSAGLEPIDFHLAVTTTSIFINDQTTASCRNDCPTAGGSQVCCSTSGSTLLSPMKVAKSCSAASDCGTGYCGVDCVGFLGEKICCDGTTKIAPATENVACPTVGAACGKLQKHYRVSSSCTGGIATDGELYPHGAFVGKDTNPRVLHFDKELYPKAGDAPNPKCPTGTCNKQGFTSAQLEGWFKDNIVVGTCGSGEEQGLQAARLALQKATAAPTQQSDTVNAAGVAAPGSPAEFPHASSKLVTVFVGDEDDCSSPEDASRGVILSGSPGQDTCVSDASQPQPKQFPVTEVVDYLTGLGRPLGAAFIVSTQSDTCEDTSCSPGQCCTHYCTGGYELTCRQDSLCGGQAGGTRFLDAAARLRQRGADVVVGSICGEFGALLGRIADIVKPPAGLVLPTQPAASDITVLRIADAAGTATRKTCKGPAPATLSYAEAVAAGWDWWFTATREQVSDAQKTPSAVSRYIFINHATLNCEANPGETYSADYLGRLPAGGCQSRTDCARTLGGRSDVYPNGDWTCFAGLSTDPVNPYVQPTTEVPGTCVCGGNQGTY